MTNQEAIEVMFNEWKCIERNDGIHCDRKCESCDLVMDVEIIREAYNMAISALEKQMPKNSNESSLTQKGLDTISRQAAIDALKEKRNSAKEWYEEASASGDEMMLSRAESAMMTFVECILTIKKLPSAQPEIVRCKDCEHRDPEDKKCDCGHAILWQLPRQDDWYCADAERRTDEQTLVRKLSNQPAGGD